MTRDEFISGRETAKREGKSIWLSLIAMLFVGSACSVLWLVGFMCILPFERILAEDRTHLFIRSVLLLILAASVVAVILVGDWMWRLRRGFICQMCHKRFDSEVTETGRCGHCGARVFDP
jgi:hypothetical protein